MDRKKELLWFPVIKSCEMKQEHSSTLLRSAKLPSGFSNLRVKSEIRTGNMPAPYGLVWYTYS